VKLPRDLSGQELARALTVYGYAITRQAGSHMRLTTQVQGEHHLTIPDHASLRVGTLAAILTEVANHFQVERSAVTDRLFG
jgi:predicted RNA binding protein YcfA (HicA-like mRNA interferase family)